MDDSVVRDLTIEREVVSYTLNRGSGRLVLLGKIDDGILHSVCVINQYIIASGNSVAIIVKIQLAGEEDELIITEMQNTVSNDNKRGEKMFSGITFSENQTRKSETHVFGSLTTGEEFGELQISKRGFQERFKRVDITLESKKQGASLLHVVGNTIPTHAEFLSLDICVSASRTIGLVVDLRPLFYSSYGLVQKMVLDFVFYDVYPPTPTTTTSRQNRPALVGGGRRRTKAAPRHSSNSGEQNFNGVMNSSGVTDGIGNHSIIIKNLSYVAFGDRNNKG